MITDELFTHNSRASADAGGSASAGDHVAIADAAANVVSDGQGVGIIVAQADAQSMGFDGLGFEMAGVNALASAGSVYGHEFGAGGVAAYAVDAGPGGIDIDLDTSLDIDFGGDVSIDAGADAGPGFGAMLPF